MPTPEGYKPSQDEITEAEESMTPRQAELTGVREEAILEGRNTNRETSHETYISRESQIAFHKEILASIKDALGEEMKKSTIKKGGDGTVDKTNDLKRGGDYVARIYEQPSLRGVPLKLNVYIKNNYIEELKPIVEKKVSEIEGREGVSIDLEFTKLV